MNSLVDVWVDFLKNVVRLKRGPANGEQGDDNEQHFDDLHVITRKSMRDNQLSFEREREIKVH